jgi:outer membrane cobalamin receptor
MFGVANPAFAQAENDNTLLEEVVVTGIRSSLQSALSEKRASDGLIEVIVADDIGKLPDQNLAEVLENISGIQITRQADIGTGVQIRGTNANRTELNGVATVGSDYKNHGHCKLGICLLLVFQEQTKNSLDLELCARIR